MKFVKYDISLKDKESSLRSSERGLKFILHFDTFLIKKVAPFVGAWIEINSGTVKSDMVIVAPFVGAWIEIY